MLQGLMAEKITIPLAERTINAFYYSDGDEKKPGILFLPDLTGISDTIQESANLLSKEGYHVILPDLYSDMGTIRYCMQFLFNEAARENRSTDNPPLQEVHEMIDFVKGLPQVDSERIGMIGQCLTGGFALQMAIRPDVKAPVVFHHSLGLSGSGFADEDARRVCQTVQGHYVYIDPMCPPSKQKKLQQQLGDKLHHHMYSQLPHGIPHFFRRNEQGRRAWNTMLTFFRMQFDDIS